MSIVLTVSRYVEKEELVKLALGELQPSSVQVRQRTLYLL